MKQLNSICCAVGVVSLAATLAMPLTSVAQGGAYFDDATSMLHLPEVDAGNLGAFSAKLQLTNADPVTFSIAELTPTAATGQPVAMYRADSNRLSVFGAAVGSQFFNAEFANSATGFELQVDSLVEDTSLDLLNSAPITGNPTWNTISGSLKQVSVGAPQHIWGTDSSDLIYRRDGNLWTNIGGNLKQVSVGCDGTVWGIQAGDLIFRWDGAGVGWTSIGGNLTQISVGNASNVWGVNVAGQVFQWQGSSLGWQQISGVNSLKQVAVGCDGTVRGLDADNAFVSWNGSQWDYATGSSTNPDVFQQLSVGDASTIWAVDSANRVFKLDSNASVWRQVPGNLSDVSAANDNTAVWGIEDNDVIVQGNQAASPAVVPKPTAVMRYTKSLNFLDGNDTAVNIEQIVSPSFTHLSGYLSDSFDRSAAFGVDKQGNVFRYSNNDWQQVSGNMEQLSVGEYTRTIWALDASGTPYSSTYDGDSWIPTNNNSLGETNVSFTQIASGRITNGLDAQGSVWSWDSGRFWVNEFITAKSIAPTVTDRVLWGINNNDEVFRYERFSRQTVTYPWSFNGKPKQIVEVELQGVGDYLVVLDSSGDLYYGSPYLGIGLGEMWVKIGSHVKQIGGAYIDGEVLHVSALTELNTPPSQRIDLIGLDITGDGNYERVLKITDQAGDSALVYQPMAILYIMKLFGIPVTQADIERFSPAQRQALAAQTEIQGLTVDDNGNIQSLELALLNNSLDVLESLEVQTGLSGSTWTEERINTTTFGQPVIVERQSGSVETFTIEVNSGSTTSTTEVTFLGYENEQRTLGTEGLPIGRNQEAYLVKAENTTTVNDTNVGATVIVGGTNNKAYVNDKSMAANKSVTLVGAEGNVGSKESTHVVAGVGVGEGAGIAASWGEGGLYGGEIEIWFFKIGFYITDDDANMVYNDSKNWLEGAANDTADWGEQAWQDTSGWFASTADTAGDATMQFIDSAENWTVNAVNDGRDVAMNVVDGAESVTLKISDATSTAVNDVSNGVDTAIRTGGSVVNAVNNEVNNLGNAIQSTANDVAGGVIDLGNTIRDGFCGIFGC